MDQQPIVEQPKVNSWNRVTPFSKYAAMALFIALPFMGGWVGYYYMPEKIVEIEKVVVVNNPEREENAEHSLAHTLAHELAPELRRDDDGVFGVVDPEKLYLYIGDNKTLLKTVPGRCDMLQKIDARHLMSEGFISNPEQIVSQVYCWYGGGGSVTHLVNIDERYKVFHYETGECGNNPDCTPDGPVEVLYEE